MPYSCFLSSRYDCFCSGENCNLLSCCGICFSSLHRGAAMAGGSVPEALSLQTVEVRGSILYQLARSEGESPSALNGPRTQPLLVSRILFPSAPSEKALLNRKIPPHDPFIQPDWKSHRSRINVGNTSSNRSKLGRRRGPQLPVAVDDVSSSPLTNLPSYLQ